MRNIILALAALAIPAAAFAGAKPPTFEEQEARRESYVKKADLALVNVDAQTVVNARLPGRGSQPDEIKATEGYEKLATKAFFEAGYARLAFDKEKFAQNAKTAKDARDKACAILTGC